MRMRAEAWAFPAAWSITVGRAGDRRRRDGSARRRRRARLRARRPACGRRASDSGRHRGVAEAAVELGPAGAAIERADPSHRRDQLVLAVARRSRSRRRAITSGTEPRGRAITGVPQARASIITRPKGSGQSIGKSRAQRAAEQRRLVVVADLAEELDPRVVEQRLDVLARSSRDRPASTLAAMRSRMPARCATRIAAIGALLRRDAAEEQQVVAGLGGEWVELGRHAVMHGGHPVGVGQRARVARR